MPPPPIQANCLEHGASLTREPHHNSDVIFGPIWCTPGLEKKGSTQCYFFLESRQHFLLWKKFQTVSRPCIGVSNSVAFLAVLPNLPCPSSKGSPSTPDSPTNNIYYRTHLSLTYSSTPNFTQNPNVLQKKAKTFKNLFGGTETTEFYQHK